MASLSELKLNEILPIVKGTFKTFDLRAIIAKSKDSPNNDWVCVFLKIRLTKDDRETVQSIHKNKMDNLGAIDQDYFKVIYDVKNIDEFDAFLGEIEKGYATIDTRKVNLPGTYWKTIRYKEVIRSNRYSTIEEREGYVHGVIVSYMDYSVAGMLSKIGLDKSDYGVKLDDIHAWLDTDNINDGNPNNIIIIFPIYCREISISQAELEKGLAKFEIHNLIVNECIITVTKSRDDRIIARRMLHATDCITESNYMSSALVPRIITLDSPGEHLEISVNHSSLGSLARKDEDIVRVLTSPIQEQTIKINSIDGTDQYQKVFVVHGHDNLAKTELARFLEHLHLTPTILHEQPNGGRTIIEKFEYYSSKVGYAFILLTPDDVCNNSPRARQNVILELGYFMGTLKRKSVCCIYKKGVEIPTDILGVLYIPYENSIDEIKLDIVKELREAGYSVSI
jgi:predicted nucleotide-binding protein